MTESDKNLQPLIPDLESHHPVSMLAVTAAGPMKNIQDLRPMMSSRGVKELRSDLGIICLPKTPNTFKTIVLPYERKTQGHTETEPESERTLDCNIRDSYSKWKKCSWVDPTILMIRKGL